MKRFALTTLLLLLSSTQSLAFENYLTNAFSPIPPSCVTSIPYLQAFNESQTRTLIEGLIEVETTIGGKHELKVTVTRIGCAVDGRSVLMVDFEGVEDEFSETTCMIIPRVGAELPGGIMKDFRLTDEPNTWYDFDELGVVCEGGTSRFYLDTKTPLHGNFDIDRVVLPNEYNGSFTLRFIDIFDEVYTAPISAYQNDLGESGLALSGRLSGNWGTSGAVDQGFLISFGELASTTTLIFLSWYTYDKNGDQLWLVGNAVYELGDKAVQVNLQVVSNGSFLGDKTATRTAAGSVSLAVKSCNEIDMGYNLEDIGLGQGSETLVRIVSMEIAGYACADVLTRIQHEND